MTGKGAASSTPNTAKSATFLPSLQPTSPPSKNAVSSSELLSMLKKGIVYNVINMLAPSKDEQISATNLPPQQSSSSQITDDRGMLGLLQLIKSSSTAANLAAVGIDLEALGLALDSNEPVTKDWESPYMAGSSALASSSTSSSASQKVPACYILPSTITLNPGSKVPHFSDETLLYLFYAFPRDRLQELAARELTSRSWRYHKELQQWLCVEGELPLTARCPSAGKPFSMYFDVASWNRVRREIKIDREDLIEDRFLKR